MGRLLAVLLTFVLAEGGSANHMTVWIGTARERSRGIYQATLDTDTGSLTTPQLAAEIEAPGFVVLHPNGHRLYSLCRLPNGEGGVAAFDISSDRQSLRLLNTQPVPGGGAAHLCVDRSGRCLFTAQYGGGSVAAFPLDDDGTIQTRSDFVEHEGSGPNRQRQEGPHPHWVGVDPDNRFLFVPDLGIDQIVIYRMDLDAGRLQRHGTSPVAAGAGPRHMKFHPNGRWAYVVNELELSVTAFRYESQDGTLEAFQTVTTLPEEHREVPNTASEIRVHANGRFLYAGNRGHDSIAAFEIDSDSGRLTFVELESVRGSHPRNFNIDPTGQWLLAAGRDSNTIAVFRIDSETGGLLYTGITEYCPSPICVEFQSP